MVKEILKTLKDLPRLLGHPKLYDPVDANDVKAEAIKWVKDCSCKKIKVKIQDNDEPEIEKTYRDYCFACIIFKHFFNITEEDLE